MKTQVAIIGGGPAGMLLSHILKRANIDSIVLERQTRAYVQKRIRAGLLEYGSVEILREVGLGERMDADGQLHDGSVIVFAGREQIMIDTLKFTGKPMMAYGQTSITEDLYAAHAQAGGAFFEQVSDIQLLDIDTEQPRVRFVHDDQSLQIDCDYIAGCDGFHGVSRHAIPDAIARVFEHAYPFGWLGIMAETPPLAHVTYANHPRGFALASMRNPLLSRYYIQCPLDTDLNDWPDERFWEELKSRFPPQFADAIATGPSIEKSIAPLRSYVIEPMSHGRLYLAGDAAHIVPPTGAKGLNLAIADVRYLSQALIRRYQHNDSDGLRQYSDTALDRVWRTQRFSWWLTKLLHRFPDDSEYEQRLREVELEYIRTSEFALGSMAEQYIGLPF